MSITDIISLFTIMVALAAIPSASVALVVTRSATLGIGNGIAVSLGIVLGDLVFIILAILGLSIVAETMGSLFMIVKYLGGTYLLWLGLLLLKTNKSTKISVNKAKEKGSLVTSFLAGFFLTLGDVKAIVFYASILPLFIDLAVFQPTGMLIIKLVTVVSVGGVKALYALSATNVAKIARNLKFENATRKTAGGLMVGAGTYLIIKA